jgi:hypothetical protein
VRLAEGLRDVVPVHDVPQIAVHTLGNHGYLTLVPNLSVVPKEPSDFVCLP